MEIIIKDNTMAMAMEITMKGTIMETSMVTVIKEIKMEI